MISQSGCKKIRNFTEISDLKEYFLKTALEKVSPNIGFFWGLDIFWKNRFFGLSFFLCVFSGLFLENLNQEKILHILKPLMAYFEKKNISSDRRGSLYFFTRKYEINTQSLK
jgi:hypothetical protein